MGIFDRIKEADAAGRVIPVAVERWGGLVVYVHRLSLADRLAVVERVADLKPAERVAYVLALSVRDEAGNRVFDPDDLGPVVELDSQATAQLWRVSREASKLFQDEAEAEAEKKG